MTRSTRNRTARARRHLADRVRARPRLEGLEDRCMLSPTITEFPIPTANGSLWITGGPDGNLWFTAGGGSKIAMDYIGMINPATHAITEFPIPTSHANAGGIAAGPDGNVWFTEGGANKIGMINPTTHAIAEFPIPTGGTPPYDITAGPDGNLWFTEPIGNEIGMINPATHAITEFPVPTASASPEGISLGPDGNLWFAEPATIANKIGEINPATHAIAEFPVPTANATPWRTSRGPDGNVWFAEADANQIGMINPVTHAITEFPIPTAASRPDGITAGPDGNLWFTEVTAGNVAMINPATHAITEFPIPDTGSQPYGITAGPDGNLWFADRGTLSIGVVTLNTNADHFVVTQQPPVSVTAGTPFGLAVEAEDSSGNLDSSFNGTVTAGLANNPGGATLGGTLSVTASQGVATFSNLTLTQAAAGYTLAVSSSGVDSVTTSAITVTPAAAAQLVITQQPPATVKVSSPFTMKASIEDAYGNVVTTASGSVSVAFANNPTGATLGGTRSVTTSQGVASFTNLTINKIGSGYTLQVSSSGLTSATSNPINVTRNGHGPAIVLPPTGNPTTDLSLAPLVFDSPDFWDGLRFKKRSRSI
jgi:streptogramin lyase